MIYIVWSDHDGTRIEKFGEGLDGTQKAEKKILELHNLAESSDNHSITIDMIIRGNEVQYGVKETASVITLSG